MVQKKIAVILGYECNNNCRFCYCGSKKDKFKSMTIEQAKKILNDAFERGCNFVDFNGGEPTLRKDIFELVSYAKKIGFKTIALTTNGRMFSYENFAKKMVECGLNHVVFSVHGHKAELHDYLTRSRGSFVQTTTGLKNLRKIKPDIYICTNTTINRLNYKFLPQIAENNIKLGADGCEFIFVHPRGNALKNFEDIVPTLKELAPFIPKLIEVGKKHNVNHFHLRYLPLCYMVGFENHLSELVALPVLREQHIGPEFEDLKVEEGRKFYGRVKGPQCKACKYYDVCEGIFKEYVDRRGFEELVPVA